MQSLCILLPLRLQAGDTLQALLHRLRTLGSSLTSAPGPAPPDSQPALSVCLGVDEDDAEVVAAAAELQRCFPPAAATAVRVFGAADLAAQRQRCGGAAPLCWMWSELAEHAQQAFHPAWTILLGDDVQIEPAGWPRVLAGFIAARPHLRCVALLDAGDPGFPSFPAVVSTHLEVFGRMLPGQLLNQGGDPLLYELYRGVGAAAVCPAVSIANAVGGCRGSIFPLPAGPLGAAGEPRYARRPLPVPQWRLLLGAWRQQLLRAAPELRQRLQVAVAVPTYRVSIPALTAILERCTCSDPEADVRALVCVDNPCCPPDVLDFLRKQQRGRLDRMRVRLNPANLGAAGARNALLDEASACDLIIFFDDDVVPTAGCVDAYVAACRAHPGAAGFAGPTYLPRCPTQLLPTAIHMSDVSFFWEAPDKLSPCVPWAVTANMAMRCTDLRFSVGFPKTGGGEDVDFCVQLGARLVAVPGAAAQHPWWPEGRPQVYMRFWRWAEGDGRLIQLWPQLAYRRAPNPPELCLLLLALGCIPLCCGLLSAAGLAGSLLAVLAADLLLTLARNCCLPERCRQHPCAWWLRPAAAAEAFVVATLYSEGGRLAGHLKRASWRSMGSSFDWFCGALPEVVAGEKRRAAARACWCLAAAAAWLALYGRL